MKLSPARLSTVGPGGDHNHCKYRVWWGNIVHPTPGWSPTVSDRGDDDDVLHPRLQARLWAGTHSRTSPRGRSRPTSAMQPPTHLNDMGGGQVEGGWWWDEAGRNPGCLWVAHRKTTSSGSCEAEGRSPKPSACAHVVRHRGPWGGHS